MGRQDSLQGSLPLLVLTILARRGPMHGYGITSIIETMSDVLRIEEGSLYPRFTAWKKKPGSRRDGQQPGIIGGRAFMRLR